MVEYTTRMYAPLLLSNLRFTLFFLQLTDHLEQMLQAAFNKFNTWHARQLAKRK